MANDKKKEDTKKPKFKIYWVYIAIIAALIAVQFFGSNETSEANKTTPAHFFEYLTSLIQGLLWVCR